MTERAHAGRDMGTDMILGPTDASRLITPEGSECRLRFHLGDKVGIEVGSVSGQKAPFN